LAEGLHEKNIRTPDAHSEPGSGLKGIAPDGYYPAGCRGSTFTGSLLPSGNDPSRFTLVYTKNGKSETFSAHVEAKCRLSNKAGVAHSFQMAAFSAGAVLTAYYRNSQEQNDARKREYRQGSQFRGK